VYLVKSIGRFGGGEKKLAVNKYSSPKYKYEYKYLGFKYEYKYKYLDLVLEDTYQVLQIIQL